MGEAPALRTTSGGGVVPIVRRKSLPAVQDFGRYGAEAIR